jgi:NAD(P)-dependent dehydrogenase (short-subunit alcohol dehydrogenase family)
MPNYPELRDRTILVTGGANGIGASIVRTFQAQGARVFFSDLDADSGNALARELGDSVHFTAVNLLKESQIHRWIDAVHKQAGKVDVVVNNAARDPRIPFATMTSQQWDDLFAGNLRAYFLVAQRAERHMPPGSSIINLASITFHSAPTPMSAYVATKGGVIGFTRSLARELGPKRIRVNTVSPGWVMTDRQLKQFVTPAVKRLIRKSQCLPDLIQPDEIADVVLFLASDSARAMTGQELLVDRGWMHH